MIKELESRFITDWTSWLLHFDNFISHGFRDDNDKLWKHRNDRSYCTWEVVNDKLFTISYQYVHCLDDNGDMHCLQLQSVHKQKCLTDYKKLYNHTQSKMLPILKDEQTIIINNTEICYTKFSSPTGNLGNPPAYNLVNMMMTSNNILSDFRKYITNIVENHIWLIKQCKELNLPYYENHHVLVNHFTDSSEFYFKDTVFDYTSESIDDLPDSWADTIDGFKRAEGIISAYRSRPDASELTASFLISEITVLKNYAWQQCQKLKI
jgi:hypothetical protein